MRDATLKPSWPEGYGFKISGSGPSYVIAVERESIAYRSGISAGSHLTHLKYCIFMLPDEVNKIWLGPRCTSFSSAVCLYIKLQ